MSISIRSSSSQAASLCFLVLPSLSGMSAVAVSARKDVERDTLRTREIVGSVVLAHGGRIEHFAQRRFADLQIGHQMVKLRVAKQGLHGFKRLARCHQPRGERAAARMARCVEQARSAIQPLDVGLQAIRRQIFDISRPLRSWHAWCSYLREVLGRIAEHPINRIEELLPWHFLPAQERPKAA